MIWIHKVFFLALISLTTLLLTACSPRGQAPAVSVEEAVMNQLAPGQSIGAVYMRIANNTEGDIVLNYVHAPIASDIEVHRTIYDKGMMQMRPVNHVRVEAGKSLSFEPGGYHLMLFGVESQPDIGQTFELTLEFEGGLKAAVPVVVKRPG